MPDERGAKKSSESHRNRKAGERAKPFDFGFENAGKGRNPAVPTRVKGYD